MLEYEAANLVPASWDILDWVIADDSATEEESRLWVREVARYEFLEAGLHNDSLVGGPPTYLVGKGLYDHIRVTEERLGIRVYTCGRHGGAHAHPETLDAMDYAYEQVPDLLGTCTFCFYDMWEYGEHAYETDGSTTVASSGFWFPYHPVITRVEKHKALRGLGPHPRIRLRLRSGRPDLLGPAWEGSFPGSGSLHAKASLGVRAGFGRG